MATDKDVSENGRQQLLTFAVKGELYAVHILRVREIVRQESITKVPYAPDWVRGVMNLRGNVVPVADLALRFGLSETEIGRTTCVLILETLIDGDAATVGLLAEGVNDVITVAEEDIEPPPPLGTRVWPEYLIGLTQTEGRFAQILEVTRLLSGMTSELNPNAQELASA